jgi:DNA-binding IclR family transcriptional regulator
LLSQLRDDELHVLLNNIRFVPIGPNTITDKEILLEQLNTVREKDYATSFGERIAGVGPVAVLVRSYVCPVALGVLGPDNRFSLETIMQYLQEIKDVANRISMKFLESVEYQPRKVTEEKDK